MKIPEKVLKIKSKIDTEKNRIKFFSFLAYLGPLFVLGMIYNKKNINLSLKFHNSQGFMLLLLEIFLIIVYFLLKAIPYVGIIISQLYYLVAVSVCIVCILVGFFHVILSVEKPIPYVGKFVAKK